MMPAPGEAESRPVEQSALGLEPVEPCSRSGRLMRGSFGAPLTQILRDRDERSKSA
jgi:hypothetical protein